MSDPMPLIQADLVNLCVDEGWKPYFLEVSDQGLDDFKLNLQREIEVVIAEGRHHLARRILTYVADHQRPDISEELESSVPVERVESSPQIETPFHDPISRDMMLVALLDCLEGLDLKPRFLGHGVDGDLADLCGREMKHFRAEQRHDVVVRLGRLANHLKLEHKRIAFNLRASSLAVSRSNRLVILRAMKESPHRSRAEYEEAIVQAWSVDPDCGDYLELLKKVVSYRLRQRSASNSFDAYESEFVEHAMNQRLWRSFSRKSKKPKGST